MQKAIEKRVDSLLNQSPKALAAMASQITDDILSTAMNGGDDSEGMEGLEAFMHKYIKPMDARTYHIYRDEYSLLREHYWMNLLLKSWKAYAELRRDYLTTLKVALTYIRGADHIREYAGLPASEPDIELDVDDLLNQTTTAIEEAETTVREWSKPDIWQRLGYEPPIDENSDK